MLKKSSLWLLILCLIASMLTVSVFADENTNALPNAEVTSLGAQIVTVDSYYIYDLVGSQKLTSASDPFALQIAMEFAAKDTPEQAEANAYGGYTTDFFIEVGGLANGSVVADGCYLAGYYATYGAWVVIPLDGFTIEQGVTYPVITSAGFDFSYVDICASVQDFVCGIYFTDEVLAANPDLTVELSLGLSENADEARDANFVCVDSYTYDVEDFENGDQVADAFEEIAGAVDSTELSEAEQPDAIAAALQEFLGRFTSYTEGDLANAKLILNIVAKDVVANESNLPARFVYDVTPQYGIGNSRVDVTELDEAVSFKLPVPANAIASGKANVYHGEEKLDGTYDIEGSAQDGYYVVVEAKNFSEYSVEPIAPVVVVANAQEAQDALYNAVPGTTIQLVAGVDYGTIVFGRNASQKVVDIGDIGGDAAGNERYSKYENIVILGAEGATVDQITFEIGRVYNPDCWSYVEVKNLTIKDVTFTGEKTAVKIPDGFKMAVNGLSLINCTMHDADGNDRLVYQPHSGHQDLYDKTTGEYVMTTGVKNLTITGCEVVGAYQVIEARPMKNLTITNNTFKGIKARDILLASNAGTYTGTILIADNTSEAGTERFLRASNIGDATMIVTDNTITNYLGKDPDFIKVGEATGTLTLKNNTASIIVKDNATAQAVLDKAVPGTIIQLVEGVNYGTLSFRAVPDQDNTTRVDIANAYAYDYIRSIEDITILGAAGAKVDAITFETGAKPGDWYVQVAVKNLVIDGVEFTDAPTASSAGYNASVFITTSNATVDGLTVKNCTLIGDNSKLNLVYLYGADNAKNVTLSGNTVDGVARLCELRGTENVTITNNVIKNTYEHGILLAGSNYSGTVTIANNTADRIGDRFLRMAGAGVDGLTVLVRDNTVTNYLGSSADYIKVTNAANEVTTYGVTLENNTCTAVVYVAEVNGTKYVSFQDALVAAGAGDEVILLADVSIPEGTDVTLPAGIILNGNGYTISSSGADHNTDTSWGYVVAGGNLTIKGVTKIEKFIASYYDHIITVGEGASLQVFGKNRVSLGYGSSFDVTGTVSDAKTADKSQITPSLVVNAGFSIVGPNNTYLKVTNAYVVIGSTSSKNSNASGTFDITFDNSIVEFTDQFTFSTPKNALNPTFNVTFEDCVVTSATKWCFMAPGSNVTVDNSTVALGSYLHNSGALTIKNGSTFVGSMIQYGENGGNSGTITVEDATFTINNNNTACAMDGKGTGKLVLLGNATANVDYMKDSTVTLGAGATLVTKSADVTVVPESGYEAVYENDRFTSVKTGLAGEGTVENPYLITSLADLKWFRDDVNAGNTYAGKYVKLTADIDLGNEEWTPIGTAENSFEGIFDGADFKILNLKITHPGTETVVNNVGLFGRTTGATVKNLTVENVNITASGYVGAVIGNFFTGTISNVTVKGNIQIAGYQYVGGIMGWGYGSIIDCNVQGDGIATSTIKKVAKSEIYGSGTNGYVGGVCGWIGEGGALISGCTVSNITVATNDDTVGGICGIFHYGSTFTDCKLSDMVVTAPDNDGYNGIIAGHVLTHKEYANNTYSVEVENVTATAGGVALTPVGSHYNAGLIMGTEQNGVLSGSIINEANAVAEVNGKVYATLQAAIDAAGAGDTVTLLTDLTLESALNNAGKGLFNIAANDEIILDLNGKTITVTDNSDGNFIVFYNYGELTVKNGTIKMSATKNRAWNAQSTVILNRGGKLTVESGSYIHLGGSDMAITIDNSANSFGNAYMYVMGGEIRSETYIAIRMRMEQDGIAGHGISNLEVSDGYIYGANRGIWGQKCCGHNGLQGTLAITGGTVENGRADRAAIDMDTDSYEAQNVQVTISQDAVIKGAILGGEDEFAISGGTFTVAVPKEFCAEGFVPTENADGTYGVVEATYVAEVNGVGYTTFEEALNAAQDGQTITLLADVVIANNNPYAVVIEKDITIDGNGHKISQAAGYANAWALLYVQDASVTVKNLTFDGIRGCAAIWSMRANVTVDNCVLQNCEHTQIQGLLRFTATDATIKDTKFLNNTASMLITFNFDLEDSEVSTDVLTVKGCTFEGNTCSDTALIYYVKGQGSAIENNAFINNEVDTSSHGAIVYYSAGENCTVTGNEFRNNSIEADLARAGILALEAGTKANNNAFINNTVKSNASGITYVGTVLNKADANTAGVDVSENYWNGGKPDCVGVKGAPTALDSYYLAYEDGVLSNKVEIVYVAEVNGVGYTTFEEALNAAQNGQTIKLLADVTLTQSTQIAKSIILDGNGYTIDMSAISSGSGFTIYEWPNTEVVVEIKNATIKGHSASGNYYGAISAGGGTVLTLTDCEFTNNSGDYVVHIDGAIVTIEGTTFDSNTPKKAVVVSGVNGHSDSISIVDSTFKNNTVSGTAVVYLNKGSATALGTTTLSNNTFINNKVTSSAAAVLYLSTPLTAQGNLISGNTVTGTGSNGDKCGIIATGSGANGSIISNNVLVDNTVSTTGTNIVASAWIGSNNVTLNGNYWTDGGEPEQGAGKDVYLSKTGLALETYATTYAENTTGATVGSIEEVAVPVAAIGDVKYATLQEAIDAAQNGDTITLLSDVVLNTTLYIPAEKTLIIDGAGYKLTPAADFAANEHHAVLALANGDRGYSQNSKYTVMNLTFEGFEGLTRVIRANFCDAVIENCTFNNNKVTGGIITSADAVLTVRGCTFNGNTVSGDAGYGVIDIGSDIGNGSTLKATVTGNKFTNNKVEYAVLFLFTSADVSGNYFSGNEHIGTNPNAAAILAGPYTGNMAYEINITENAFVNAMSKNGSKLPAVFAEDWSSLGATTDFNLNGNYWDGNKPTYGESGSPAIEITEYYTEYSLVNGVLTLSGEVTITYAAQIGNVKYESLLDALKNAKDGDTIIVYEGTHRVPDLTHVHFMANGDKTPANLTIVAQEGKMVVVDAIHFNVNAFPENLTVKNIIFDGTGVTPFDGGIDSATAVNGLTVENCTFKNGARITLTDAVAKNVVIKNCVFDGTGITTTPIYIPDVDGLTVTGCTISDGFYNAIQLSGTVAGDVVISNNTISGTNNRAIRLANVVGNVVISNNVFSDATDDEGELFKATSINGGSVAFTGNTYEGQAWNRATLTAGSNVSLWAYEAEVNGVKYTSLADAIKAAPNGGTVYVYAVTINGKIDPWARHEPHADDKSITILGAAEWTTGETILTGGMYLGHSDLCVLENTITVKGITFKNVGLAIGGTKTVVVENNKFYDITGPAIEVSGQSFGGHTDACVVVKNNVIVGASDHGINLNHSVNITVEGNYVENIKGNGIQIHSYYSTTGNIGANKIVVANNTVKNWGNGTEGRAIRIGQGQDVTVNGNVLFHENAPEQFVKITGLTGDAKLDVSANYWRGVSPMVAGMFATDLAGDPALILKSYYTDAEKTNLVKIGASVAKIGDTYYASITEAILAAEDGATIELLAGTFDEYVAPWTKDPTHALEKSITIVGAENFGTVLTGGIYLGYDDSGCRAHTVTIRGIHFQTKGVLVAGIQNVVIEDNKFTDISACVASSDSANGNAISVTGKNINATIRNNVIENVTEAKGSGILLRDILNATVENNTVKNVMANSITITTTDVTKGTIVVTNNVLDTWGVCGEGRAIRAKGGASITFTENVMTHANAPEQFTKLTDSVAIDTSKNYWGGAEPLATGRLALDDGMNYAAIIQNYYTDAEKTNLLAYIAEVDDVYYTDLQAAFNAAMTAGNKTVKLLSNGTYPSILALSNGVTLDLNGYTLTANNGVVTFGVGSIVDNGATKGSLKTPYGFLALSNATYPMFPVWVDAEVGYRFVSIAYVCHEVATDVENSFVVDFRPKFENAAATGFSHNDVFKDGALDNDVTMVFVIKCVRNGEVVRSIDYNVSDALIARAYTEGRTIRFTVTGATDSYDSYVVEVRMQAKSGIVFAGDIMTYTPTASADGQ